jgi:hypothetical protein
MSLFKFSPCEDSNDPICCWPWNLGRIHCREQEIAKLAETSPTVECTYSNWVLVETVRSIHHRRFPPIWHLHNKSFVQFGPVWLLKFGLESVSWGTLSVAVWSSSNPPKQNERNITNFKKILSAIRNLCMYTNLYSSRIRTHVSLSRGSLNHLYLLSVRLSSYCLFMYILLQVLNIWVSNSMFPKRNRTFEWHSSLE